ncbi:MAG: hypothetical protein JXA41_08620 [Deltaproteobacteria bacterium]|nr:hypothetical protein [Deltaproteobacteria bacterium]
MAEDLLDHWTNLIKPIFPSNAWIVSEYSKNNHLILIDWKLEKDTQEINKRSRKIQIIIREDVIDDYLDKNKHDRQLLNTVLKQSVLEQFNQFIPDDDYSTNRAAPTETWLFSKEVVDELTYRYNLSSH